MMRKPVLLLLLLVLTTAASGCRLNVNRLNKRIDRWQTLRAKEGDTGRKVKFARESLTFFLNTLDFQRSRETLVTEAERLQFHEKMSSMQVFLMDYHASLALEAANRGDWTAGDLEWSRADSLSRGSIPEIEPTTYKMVLLQSGYSKYVEEISAQGDIADRMEFRFPGVTACFRKMSRFQFLKAEKLYAEGNWEQALKHYMLVFKRDPENFSLADSRVRFISGKNSRETFLRYFLWNRMLDSFDATSIEVFGIIENQIMAARQELGEEKWEEKLPSIWEEMSKQFNMTPEQIADVYFLSKHMHDGSLPAYMSLWRYDVLRGNRSKLESYSELRG